MRKEWVLLIVIFLTLVYGFYFSVVSVYRIRNFDASYYDLGIMDQTVYNTFRGRIFALTDPEKPVQIRRMAIHNDLLLGLLSPFYAVHQGPETLVVIQAFIVAFGAIPLFLLTRTIVKSSLIGFMYACAYFLYSPLMYSVVFDFHAVVLVTSFILYMWYFMYHKKYAWASIFFMLALFSKEQVGLVTALMGIYFAHRFHKKKWGYLVTTISILWVIISFLVIIPYFRQASHFALERYHAGITPLFQWSTLSYFFSLYFPLAFTSFFSPSILSLALPEFAVNLLSTNEASHLIIFHYTALITPFVFLASIYGVTYIKGYFKKIKTWHIAGVLLVSSVTLSYFYSPLPFSKKAYTPFLQRNVSYTTVKTLASMFKDENLMISTTPKIAPFFTQRKTFYLFDSRYDLSEYIVLRPVEIEKEVYPYYLSHHVQNQYAALQKDIRFQKIFDREGIEVYQRI